MSGLKRSRSNGRKTLVSEDRFIVRWRNETFMAALRRPVDDRVVTSWRSGAAVGLLGEEDVELRQELGPCRVALGQQVVCAIERHQAAVGDE